MTDTFIENELRQLDLNLLLVFSAVFRERSVTKAARRLFLGPSAISMALSRLREAVGDDLFVRVGAGMEPTPRAEALWRELEPALTRIDRAFLRAADFEPSTSEVTFRFAAPDDLELLLLPRLLQRLAADAPHTRLVVRPSDFRTLLGRLDRRDADLALSATPTSGVERRHRVDPLFRETFSVLYDAAQLGCHGPLPLSTYLEVEHFLLSPAGDLEGAVDRRLTEMGHRRRVSVAVSHFPTIPFILASRPALAHVPSIAARAFAEWFALERCPPPVPTGDFEVSLIWHVRTDTDPASQWFRAVVRETVLAIREESMSQASSSSRQPTGDG